MGGADVYCGDQHRFRSFSCELRILASFRMSFTKEKTRAIGASAPGSASANWTRLNMASYSICWDLKCSNVSTTDDQCQSRVVQTYQIPETAKRRNAINYLDCVLSHPGLPRLNRDILASRRQRLGFQDRVFQTGTVPEKTGTVGQLGLGPHACSIDATTLVSDLWCLKVYL